MLFKQGLVIKLLLSDFQRWLIALKLKRQLLIVAACAMSSVVHSGKIYFTSSVHSEYAHAVARLLVQKLYTDSYRTVGSIHLEEVQGRNGGRSLLLTINGRQALNYQYSLTRQSNNLFEEQVAVNIVNRLIAEKKAVRTQK